MQRITDAFFWATRDPEWVVKVLIIAVILIIPIAGAINGTGWMLASLDRLRAGDERLAPANFSYLGRGWRVFAVQLIYGLAIALVASVVYLPAVLVAIQEGRGEANGAVIALVVALNLVSFGITTLGGLLYTFAIPAVVLAADARGIGAGLDLRAIWRRCRANLAHTLIAGLMLIAASFIGSLGLIVCGIGVFFTSAYTLAIQAWIIRSYELGDRVAEAA